MNCAKYREYLVAYIEGLLAEPQKQAIESHLRACPPCRAETKQLINLRNRLLTNGKAMAQSDLENVVLNRIVREQNLKLRTVNKHFQLWRKIMKSKITKLATAAAVIAIAILSITFLDKAVPTAYALERTIEASHSVRYLHIKSFKVNEDEPKEFWVEFYEDGEVKNVRMRMPEWDAPKDGAKVIVWKENKAQVWIKKKNVLVTIRDKAIAAHMLKFIEELDPRLAVERLQRKQEQGKVKIEIEDPADKSEPIVVTATSIQEDDSPFQRVVLSIDQATKLVNSVELYKLKGGEYQNVDTLEYYDYNIPIDAKMFTIDNIPADAMLIDQTTQQVGLKQNDLTDDEIAVEVVRQFFEALIARDYAAASRLYQGIPVEFLEKQLGKGKFVRIVSLGKPTPSDRNNSLRVPCKYEIEVDGVKSIVQSHPYVRPVFGQPDRWTIDGGI